MIHGHGDDIYTQGAEVRCNFSSNVFEQGNSDWLGDFLQKNIEILRSYPEPNATSFVGKLAKKNTISANTICATHGATDAIYLIAQTFAKAKTAIFAPTFAEYEDACKINQHELHFITDLDTEKAKYFDTIWLCNPNNPTGKTWKHQDLLEIIDANPQTIFVIDQTYRYFTPKETITYEEAIERKNVILIDSFTKRFALPDLRLGYVVTNSELMQKIQYYKQPWSVSQLAIEVGKFVLENEPYPLDLSKLLTETERLQKELAKHKSLRVYPSDAHFFLCELKDGTAEDLKLYLVKNYGVLIRNASNFRTLNKYFFRIATQSAEQNNVLISALRSYFKK